MEPPNIAAYAYQDVHVWNALLTCLQPIFAQEAENADPPPIHAATVPTAGRGARNTSHACGSNYPLFRGNSKYQTSPGASPLTPRVSMRLLESLNLALMEDAEDHSSGPTTPRSEESHESAATTVTCSTEGSRCAIP